MKKNRSVFILLLVLGMIGFVGESTAHALALSWQTNPILGYSVSDATGNVVVVTGPTPIDPVTLSPYLDEGGNTVLGPTIPHYSIPTDPLYLVGSPSVTSFAINPTAWDSVHWYDPVAIIAHGSGVNLDAGQTYTWEASWNFLGTPGNDPYGWSNTGSVEGTSFIMLKGSIWDLWREDMGNWQYTEKWTDNGTGGFITSTSNFTVTPIPGAVWLLGSGIVGLIGLKRRSNKKEVSVS